VHRFEAGDLTGESYARVLIVKSGAANVTAVAEAFQCARLSVYREIKRFDSKGIEGLLRGKRGPRQGHKLRDAALRRLAVMRREGVPKSQCAHRLGVTEGAIRAACKRLGLNEPSAVESIPLPLSLGNDALIEEAPSVADEVLSESSVQGVPLSSKESGPERKVAVVDANSAVAADAGADASSMQDTAIALLDAGVELAADESVACATTAEANAVSEAAPAELDSEESSPPLTALHGTSDAWNRDAERALAALGLLEEAPPQFGPARHVRGAGALLAMPALLASGMFEVARDLYRSFGKAFYGVPAVFLAMALMALLRVRRPEKLRHRSPVDLGRLLGLDRAPEVKTLRRRIAALASRGQSEEFQRRLAQRRASALGDALGFLYVDGHVRAYNGKHELPKAHMTRLRLSMPATVDHWVNDRDGEPLLVVTATPTASTAHELPGVLAQVRGVVGDRRVTVVFDRGGWSPKLFAKMVNQGFDFLTYRKGRIPKVRRSRFVEHRGTFDGREVRYQLAERKLRISGLTMREVVRLSDTGEHQTSIVTSRKDLSLVETAYRMFARWRQENFFKYMGEEFELDALVQYGVEAADEERDVPNPLRRAKEREISAVRKEIAALEKTLGAALGENEESRRPTVRGFKIAHGETGKALRNARTRLERLRTEARDIPRRVTAKEAAAGKPVVRLHTDSKRLTDTVKMIAYQAESALVRMLRPHYSRVEDEGRKLIASAFELAGDLDVSNGELLVSLEPAASPNRTKAIAALCAELNASAACFPGTTLRLRFAIREA